MKRDSHISHARLLDVCPFCRGKNIIKKGVRKKKYESVQLYFCNTCKRKITPQLTKGKTYPLAVILDSITLYNRLNSLEYSVKAAGKQYGISVSAQNLSNWLKEYREHLPFLRMRSYVAKKYGKREAFVESKMFHGQIYDFKYHRAKTDCILGDDFRHYKLSPLQEFLELVVSECPHTAFKNSANRASEYKGVFPTDQVKITRKANKAVENARLILQTVVNNKLRHETLQEFMLVNDSVTVACEVPILLDSDDISHYNNILGFNVPLEIGETDMITGHIDLVQVRNGQVHILDYKPSAKKQKPLDQLTVYALALSRLTGLRLMHFKCAWFDKDDYFEFYPLHVVYKKKRKRRRKHHEEKRFEDRSKPSRKYYLS